jgi:hypothetical protein
MKHFTSTDLCGPTLALTFFLSIHSLQAQAPVSVPSASNPASDEISSSTPNVPRPKTELPELVTDRPDFTESAEVVGKAVFQVESGFSFDKSTLEGERSRSISGPFPLLRLGISKRVEFRFAGDGYSWQRVSSVDNDERTNGRSDYSLGGKVKFFDQTKLLPDFAVIAAVTVPKGHPQFRSNGYDPEIKFCVAKDAPLGFALSSNFNFASVKDGSGRFLARALTLSAGHAVWRDLSMYAETYNVTIDRGLGTSTIVNAGLTHPIGKGAQVDILTGHSVAGRQVGWFVGVGLSIRQPLSPTIRN